MAIINLTLHNLSNYTEGGDVQSSNITLSTEQNAPVVILSVGDDKNTKLKFELSLVDFGFKKKMYQPTEILAEILIRRSDKNDKTSIKRNQIETLFKYLQVSLKSDDGTVIGDDYYVHEAMPHYQTDYMYATLKIYSLDKLLTLRKACHAHTAKKLTTILEEELKSYKTPYKVANSNGTGSSQIPITANTDNMKVLKYTKNSNKYDHIFPYLVQYNESFYDMLARTCNRWGEFLFYENGALNIGYDESSSNEKALSKCGKYRDIYYFDYGEKDKDLPISSNKSFNLEASNDDQFIGNVLEKSPEKVEGLLFSPGEKGDKVAMKTIASFFKNEKNIPTFITNWLFDELWNLAASKSTAAFENAEFNNEYFSSTSSEHYSDGKKYNQFTEYGTDFNDSNYRDILAKEEAAGKNAIHIDFDTSYPLLNLGNILSYDEGKFIVVEITCKKKTTMKYKLENNVIKEDPTSSFVFEVIATASENPNSTDGKYGNFYPAVIPSGHIRQAAPQIATINNAEDPSGKNQVRVVFPWQYDLKGKEPKKMIGDATPWLRFASNAAGLSAVGQHYEDDKVLVGFVDGNVERPYVLGGLTTKGSGGSDIIHTTPGSHTFKLTDDPAGLSKFLTGMFLPVWGTASDFFPQMSADVPDVKWEASKKLGGGFELTDNYGIYKISGSTDERCVNVASPWGEVNISAFTGITISAPNGDITIKGKNVSIEAGNNLELISGKNVNYKLWKEKTTKLGTFQYVLLDVAAAVAKKLTEKLVNIIDLSIIRSVVEIVMRPVEGSLTVKSNRYLKLEAGKNECDYPAEGYSDFRTQSSYLKFKDKFNAKRSAGFYSIIPNSNMGSSMEELFKKISNLVDDLDKKYKTIYNECVTLKGQLETCYTELDKYVNTNGKKSYDADTLDKLYKEKLKADLWKAGKFESFTEDNLKLSGEVKVDDNATVSDDCIARNPNDFPPNTQVADKKKIIIQKRKEKRAAALKKLNALRKEICKLLNLELDASDIGKTLSWFLGSAAPQDFKKNMNTSFSRSKCKDSRYYKFTDDDPRKNLASQIQTDKALSINDIKYMKRLVALNLLDEFGFTNDDLRKKVNNVLPPIPETEPYASTENGHIMNFQTWRNFVKSLNGIPSIERDKSLIANAIEDAAQSAWDNINVWDGIFEKLSWGEGKKGQILFGADGNTYALKDKTFSEIVPLSPKVTSLLENDNDLSSEDKQIVTNFLNKIRTVLNGY